MLKHAQFPYSKIEAMYLMQWTIQLDDKTNSEKAKVSSAMFKKLGVKEEPVAFNTSYQFLTDKDIAKGFGFEFGEKKPLV